MPKAATTSSSVTRATSSPPGSATTAAGFFALESQSSGIDNSGFGYAALDGDTTGYYNTAVGIEALATNTTGAANTAIGQLSDGSTGTALQKHHGGRRRRHRGPEQHPGSRQHHHHSGTGVRQRRHRHRNHADLVAWRSSVSAQPGAVGPVLDPHQPRRTSHSPGREKRRSAVDFNTTALIAFQRLSSAAPGSQADRRWLRISPIWNS